MIYSTCSLSVKQNEEVVASFLKDEPLATLESIDRDGIPCEASGWCSLKLCSWCCSISQPTDSLLLCNRKEDCQGLSASRRREIQAGFSLQRSAKLSPRRKTMVVQAAARLRWDNNMNKSSRESPTQSSNARLVNDVGRCGNLFMVVSSWRMLAVECVIPGVGLVDTEREPSGPKLSSRR